MIPSRRAFLTRYLVFVCFAPAVCPAADFDLILKGGRVVDGMGNPWYRADVGIRGGLIAEIGDLQGRGAKRVIEAGGQIVAPGFIDMMGARSLPLLLNSATGGSKLRQGITTMMAGEGDSDAPQNERTLPKAAADAGVRWKTLAEYAALLEKKGLPLNVVHNVGAAQVREIVIGEEDRPPTSAEMDRMKELVAQAMRDGAVALSSALIYAPGAYARTAELVELAKVAARYGGFYSTHMRNESAGVLEAIREALEIGEKAGVPVHIYHLKAAGRENWPLMPKAVAMLEQARARGIDVTADIYPYIRNGLGLRALIPPRHYVRGVEAFVATLSDPKVREAVRHEIETTTGWENWYRHAGSDWDNVLVALAPRGVSKRYEGKSVAEIAGMNGKDVWDTFFDLVMAGDIGVNPKSMDEEQKRLAMRAGFITFCTDSEPVDLASASSAHPRAFGTYPRILAKYVREERVIGLEEAIRKMTSLPANRLRLFDRGRIAPGMAADLVVFDPVRIRDTATFARPLSFPEEIGYVLVNGTPVVDGGQSTAALPGRLLRGAGSKTELLAHHRKQAPQIAFIRP